MTHAIGAHSALAGSRRAGSCELPSWAHLRDSSRVAKPHDFSCLHFPLGGERFRPCMEDVIQFLVHDCGVDALPGWKRHPPGDACALPGGSERLGGNKAPPLASLTLARADSGVGGSIPGGGPDPIQAGGRGDVEVLAVRSPPKQTFDTLSGIGKVSRRSKDGE
jgi:hypothetical protein